MRTLARHWMLPTLEAEMETRITRILKASVLDRRASTGGQLADAALGAAKTPSRQLMKCIAALAIAYIESRPAEVHTLGILADPSHAAGQEMCRVLSHAVEPLSR